MHRPSRRRTIDDAGELADHGWCKFLHQSVRSEHSVDIAGLYRRSAQPARSQSRAAAMRCCSDDARGRWRRRARRRNRRCRIRRAAGAPTPSCRICAFSAWPAPTTAFFTAFGAYSATADPARAGTSMATPRAWPSFSVAAASRLTKVASTAASCGENDLDDAAQARRGWRRAARRAERVSCGRIVPAATKLSREPRLRRRPSRCA